VRVLLHPGAGALWKRWPAGRFAAVGEKLRERGYEVALIEGPADRDAVERCQAAAQSPFPVLRDRSLPELAHALRSAALFVGNDSGVTHLAAAAGVPTLALFGPTDPDTWAPRGNQVRVLRRCDARALEPRQIRVCAGDCLERITVEEVLAAAEAMLAVDNSVDNRDE
jgi:ADP-heptose:LPS heptosyltransferase